MTIVDPREIRFNEKKQMWVKANNQTPATEDDWIKFHSRYPEVADEHPWGESNNQGKISGALHAVVDTVQQVFTPSEKIELNLQELNDLIDERIQNASTSPNAELLSHIDELSQQLNQQQEELTRINQVFADNPGWFSSDFEDAIERLQSLSNTWQQESQDFQRRIQQDLSEQFAQLSRQQAEAFERQRRQTEELIQAEREAREAFQEDFNQRLTDFSAKAARVNMRQQDDRRGRINRFKMGGFYLPGGMIFFSVVVGILAYLLSFHWWGLSPLFWALTLGILTFVILYAVFALND